MRSYENKALSEGFCLIAGVDEAGRGPLAGPVVSAAVILLAGFTHPEITDSKKLSPSKRDRLYQIISEQAVDIGIGMVSSEEIDRINILQAALKSMCLAVGQLQPKPDYLLIDGKFTLNLPLTQEAIIKGDSLSLSIAAASIIAKVTRDRIMADYHEQFPHYGFSVHKGYPTVFHKEAIKKYGPCPIHRLSFKGVREYAQ